MTLAQFLTVLGATVGFMAAAFFAWGVLRSSDKDLYEITSMKWDINQHWADSIAEQRADYKVGALLFLLSFASQLAANLVPPTSAPSLLQPFAYAIVEIVVVVALLLACSVWRRNISASTTKDLLRTWRAKELAVLGAEQE